MSIHTATMVFEWQDGSGGDASRSTHGVLLGPGTRGLLVACPLVLVELCDLRDEGVVGVGVGEEGADGEEDLRYGQRRAPLLLEDVQADAAIGVDVWVIHLDI